MNKIYIVLFLILTFIGINIKAETVIMETSKGSITINLDSEKAPITVENFLNYVDEGFYDDLIFHRVIKGFMMHLLSMALTVCLTQMIEKYQVRLVFGPLVA